MADIRINALATTAASTASDDFVAVDGSANGTRKLNAFSPTFGGNLTVSGAGTNGFKAVSLSDGATYGGLTLNGAIASGTMSGIYGGGDSNLYATAPTSVWILTAGTERARFTSTATILANNLTVNGTAIGLGGSTVPAWSSHNVLQASDLASFGSFTGNKNAQVMHNAFWNGSAYKYIETAASSYYAQTAGVHSWFTAASGTAGNTITFAEAARITNNGNLLIGTNVDSSALLQVGTNTTTAAGGMKFGTDTSLYRSAAGQLRGPSSFIDATFASSGLFFGASMTLQANDNVLIKTNGSVTALTLDTSQNATFAGTSVTVDGASTGSTLTLKRASNANGAIISYKTTTTSKWYHGLRGLVDDNWYLQNDVAGNTALFFDASTSNATFAGSIAIGNTVNTVSPTSPNRTITMVIGGTTYYIHAKTTND